MNILVIGGGGREHALCWKLKQSPLVKNLFCAPGNAGTEMLAQNLPLRADDVDGLLEWALKHFIDLTIVGPEQPLALGIVDVFRQAGLLVFGPTRQAAQLETSKSYAKRFMRAYLIPTAKYAEFDRHPFDDIHHYLESAAYPLVLKADGLAAGKGVIIANNVREAIEAARHLTTGASFGEAGNRLVIEEYLEGIEASVFAICDGKGFATLAPAQDHKRIFDDDQGGNTGGMGAFAPTPHVPLDLLTEIKARIIQPTLDGMIKEGMPYTGVLFVGLMLTADGPKVLEFNCRFGDPETQVILPLINTDLAVLLADAAREKLSMHRVPMHEATAVCVVMASGGYPEKYETGKVISGLENIRELEDGVLVFHAGTKKDGDAIFTSGGRVLGITAIGPVGDLRETIHQAYAAVHSIRFDGAYYRTDIAKKGIL